MSTYFIRKTNVIINSHCNEKTISIRVSDFDGLQCWGYEGFNWD